MVMCYLCQLPSVSENATNFIQLHFKLCKYMLDYVAISHCNVILFDLM